MGGGERSVKRHRTAARRPKQQREDLLSSSVCRAELRHFKRRHPEFGHALARLQRALEKGFIRKLKITDRLREEDRGEEDKSANPCCASIGWSVDVATLVWAGTVE
jgi:hypothetical protein